MFVVQSVDSFPAGSRQHHLLSQSDVVVVGCAMVSGPVVVLRSLRLRLLARLAGLAVARMAGRL